MSDQIEPLNFETALAELETTVRQLESGKTSLDDSVVAYERGMALRQICETRLTEAELKIQKVAVGANGAATITPIDPETLT